MAVEQAKVRLRRAGEAVQRLKVADSYEAEEDAWTDFLLACSAIYSKLEQGAKVRGKSSGWFGQKKKERKDDPLLRYLHFARNSDEHGIERIVERQLGSSVLRRPLKYKERVPMKVVPIDQKTMLPTGDWHDAFAPGAHLLLVRVHDHRFGDSCDPPTAHMGVTIDHRYPHTLAEAAMPYFDALVRDAESLV